MISEWMELLRNQQKLFKLNIQRNLIQNFSNSLTQQYQSIYLTALGADPIILGTIYSLSGLINTLLSIPTGITVDNIGVKKTLMITGLISIIGTALFSVSKTWTIGALALILTTVGYNLNFTICPMICGSVVKSSVRVTVMGICDTITFIPFLIGPIIAATIITYSGGMNEVGIRPLFFLQVTGLVLSLFLIYTRFFDPTVSEKREEIQIISTFKNILSETNSIKSWILLYMLSMLPYYATFYTPLFAAEVKGANQFIVGGISSASMLVSVVLAVPIGHLADKVGRRIIFIISTFLSCGAYLVLIYASKDILFLVSGFLSGFVMPVMVILSAISFDLVPKEYLGSWLGIMGFIGGVVNIVAPIVCGFLWDNISPQSVFFFLIFVRFLSILTLLMIPSSVIK
jgi:MFS family permease